MIFGLMKATLSNEYQIIKAIKEHVAGLKAEDIVRNLGISQGTFYKFRSLSMSLRGARGAH
jgi:putative transposase